MKQKMGEHYANPVISKHQTTEEGTRGKNIQKLYEKNKNCGIDEDAIKEALEEAYERGVKAGIVIGEDNTIRYMEYAIQPAKNPLGTSKEDVFYSRKDLISFIEVLKNI